MDAYVAVSFKRLSFNHAKIIAQKQFDLQILYQYSALMLCGRKA